MSCRAIACALAVVLLCLSPAPYAASDGFAQARWMDVNGVSLPVPPAEHPRLYLRRQHVPDLEKRMAHPVLKPVWEELLRLKALNVQDRVEMDALLYLQNRDRTLGRQTITAALDTMRQSNWPDQSDISRLIGRMIVTGAIVYDWCYELLTADEKEAFIAEFIRMGKMLECGYPPRGGAVTGHASEWMVMRDLLSAGIACYDEFPEIYHLAAGRFFQLNLPARNFFYPAHAYHQGDSYGQTRYGADLFPLWIFDRLGFSQVYHPSQQFVPYSWIYMRQPDGKMLLGGDSFLAGKTTPDKQWPLFGSVLFSSSYYNDGYIYHEFLRNPVISEWPDRDRIYEFLWRNPDLTPRPPDDLPLSRYFGYPFGWMIARTGWGDDGVIAEMKVNVYHFANHKHLDAGNFQLYYKGNLAIDAGLYRGYGQPHDYNFYKRTIAHNALLIHDPSEQFSRSGSPLANDGGQRMPNRGSEPGTLEILLDPANQYKTGEVLGYGFGPDKTSPDYTWLKGDITAAYSEKVKDVKRSFVFLNMRRGPVPSVLIVFDKVESSNPSFRKSWLLHSMEEPVVRGNETVVVRTQDGGRGKLINTTLLPEPGNAAIQPIGGPGKEFWVAGENYPPTQRPGRATVDFTAGGSWRVEISPVQAAGVDYFLNVMQVMDQNVNTGLPVQLIQSGAVTGVRIADRIVLFNKTSERTGRPVSFAVEGKNMFRYLITDLAEGTWQVLRNGEVFRPAILVTSEEGALYFEGPAGKYTLLR